MQDEALHNRVQQVLARDHDVDRLFQIFQPIVALRINDEIERYQTLLRMASSDGELLDAGQILHSLRGNGAAPALDRWSLHNCITTWLRCAKHRRRARFCLPCFEYSITDKAWSDWARREMREQHVADDSIMLDFSRDQHGVLPLEFCRAAHNLRDAGFELSWSNFVPDDIHLAELAKIPVAGVRLHRGFVDEVLNSGEDGSDKLAEMVERVHEQFMHVTVTMVEDPDTLSKLCAAGVDFVQGYFVQPPAEQMVFEFVTEGQLRYGQAD